MKSYYEWGKHSLRRLVRGANGELRESIQGMAREESETEREVQSNGQRKNIKGSARCVLREQKNMAVEGGKSPRITGLSINILKIPIIGPWLARILGGGIT